MTVPGGQAGPIGLVGIGLVGTALVERLLGAGYAVVGCDIDAERRRSLEALGGRAVEHPLAVADACETVLLSLMTSATVRQVVWGEEGLLAGADPPDTVIDTTTGDPQDTAALGAGLAERDIIYLDATISGSSQQVRCGEAVYMVGGSPEAFAGCAPLFDALGGDRIHLGPVGSGARAKLATNLVLGLNRLALAEGLLFGRGLGLDPAGLLDLLQRTPAYSRQMDNKGPKMAAGEYAPQARLAQHAKDVDLILQAAGQRHLHLPVSRLHRALLRAALEAGDGDLDNSAILRQLERMQAVPDKNGEH